jgi:peroxiredoxin
VARGRMLPLRLPRGARCRGVAAAMGARCSPAATQQQRQQQQQQLRRALTVGASLVKGPGGFDTTTMAWVKETVSDKRLVAAHPWFTDRSNDETDNSTSLPQLFGGRRVALFGLPAPFTGTCTEEHVPGYVALQDEFTGMVDELVCFSLADPYAMHHWRAELGVDPAKISFLADPSVRRARGAIFFFASCRLAADGCRVPVLRTRCDTWQGEVTRAWNVEWDLSEFSLGVRSRRFSLLAQDGEVVAFNEVEDARADAAVLLSQCR